MYWISENKEWLLSGLGVAVMGWLWRFFSSSKSEKSNASVVINNSNIASVAHESPPTKTELSLPERKSRIRILFIDDDTKFKVVKILIRSGWINTSIIKDASTLDDQCIINAHILFVDVQGVGAALGFDGEGLGLSLALKEKYKDKKIIIYSAETNGNRFHEALRKADSFLPKNADPYEFQKLVEELSSEVVF